MNPSAPTPAPPSASPVSHSGDNLGAVLAEKAYLASRLQPRLRDRDFLILSDVLSVVSDFARRASGRLFDFGSGGAPYRSLFHQCPDYIRADVTPGPAVDRIIQPDGTTGEPSGTYDTILSTQVLEHVADPLNYIRECHRLLRPGGRLLITTHGMFEEHGCPYDFHRWTVIGLERLVREGGLIVDNSWKLTTQIRGTCQLHNCFNEVLRAPGKPIRHLCFSVLRKFHRWFMTPVFNLVGSWAGGGAVRGDDPAWIYVGIAVEARKPGA